MRHVATALILLMLATGGMATQVDPGMPNFCLRLAADGGIEVPATPPSPRVWTANAVNFRQRFFGSGSAATSVGVTPVEPVTVEDYRRVENMCRPEGQGAICDLVGPVDFKFSWKGRSTVTRLHSGERATISVKGTRASCKSHLS